MRIYTVESQMWFLGHYMSHMLRVSLLMSQMGIPPMQPKALCIAATRYEMNWLKKNSNIYNFDSRDGFAKLYNNK